MKDNETNEQKEIYETLSETDYRKIKARLQELQGKRTGKFIKLLSLITTGVSMAVSLLFFFEAYNDISLSSVILSAGISISIAVFFCGIFCIVP